MNIYFFIIFILVNFKLKNAETPFYINNWVVWNVGQGQWVTHILSDECRHYDMGGEFKSFNPIKKSLLSFCGNKPNKINLSHWDYDHILNIPQAARSLPNLCWQNLPEPGHTKKTAQKILELRIPNCLKQATHIKIWIPLVSRDTNSSSIIYSDENVLTTGDSPIKQEKLWVHEMKNVRDTRVLILGHHGSRTSTGTDLLKNLNHLNYSIVSSRYAKYKHPHPDTLKRLFKFKIPILKTEDWGNIWFF